jgi:geranylgeranyl diphosphate synthase type II
MPAPDTKPGYSAFLATLEQYGGMARSTLLQWMPAGEPYAHLYGPMRHFIENSGKGLRPALLIASCRAFGGKAEDALPAAAVLELLHNAFLIHDDIEDVSDFRRGNRCLHHEVGVPLAINMGDAMQAMAWRLLRGNLGGLSPETGLRVVDEFDHLLKESLEGQALELGMIRDNALDISPADYLQMTLKKTCWYSFIHPCRLGALIARPDDVASGALDLDSFNAFGFYLGAAFQIQDDVLNLIGSQKKYGKEIGGDIYEGKRTLMLARLAGLVHQEDRDKLSGFLSKPRNARSTNEVSWLLDRMEKHNCIPYAQEAGRDLLRAAQTEFDRVFDGTNPTDRQFLSDFISYINSRNK